MDMRNFAHLLPMEPCCRWAKRAQSEHRLIPLSLYSLDYSPVPLLLIDFQDPTRAKRREISQRAWNDIVHGVLGLTLTANWYYFAGSAVYDYIQSRHGKRARPGKSAGLLRPFSSCVNAGPRSGRRFPFLHA